LKISNILNGLIVGKSVRLKALIVFCKLRLLNNRAYTNKELDQYDIIKNNIKDTSTTTSKTLSEYEGEDIV